MTVFGSGTFEKMQTDEQLLHFWVIFLHWNQTEIWKKKFCCPAWEFFCCLPPRFCCLSLWKTVRLLGKKLPNATNTRFYLVLYEVPVYFGDTFIRWNLSGAFFSLENCSHFSKSMYVERSQKIGVKACLKTIKRAHYKNFCNS